VSAGTYHLISSTSPGSSLQGYFDGTLKIQLTKLYDFNIPIPEYKN
jgi:hypothetical protein